MRLAIAVLLWTSLLVSNAWSDVVVFLSSPACLRLDGIPLAQPFTVEIKAYEITPTTGFVEMEFAVAGLSPAQGVQVLDLTPNPLATSASGNPFAAGARISFADCQSEVTLYTATLIAIQNTYMPAIAITAHSAPTDPSFQCPTAMQCTGGEPVRACADGSETIDHAEPPPYSPYPTDSATRVPLDVLPSWRGGIDCNCLGLVCLSFWLGTDPEPPLVLSGCDEPFPDLNLQPLTTYYWRVAITNCGSGTSPVWSFTTGNTIAVEANTWGTIKQFYR